MRQTLLVAIIIAALFISGGFFFLSNTKSFYERTVADKELREDGPLQALSLEFLKTRDPQLNAVPIERLYAAMEQLASRATLTALAKGTGVNYSSVTWTERGPTDIGGRTRAIIFDLNDATRKRVFAAAVGGGLWRCNDITATTTLAGPVWTPVNDQFANLAVTTIAQDSTNPNIIYFGTGEGWGNVDAIKGGGIWKSTDGGLTFSRLTSTANVSTFDYVQKIIVTSADTLYAATRSSASTGGILKSTNGGGSWTRVIGTNASNNRGADLEVGSNGDLFATVGIFSTGRIFRSLASQGVTKGDSGTWVDITPPLLYTPTRIEIATGPSTTIYALYTNSATNSCDTITYSSNNGTTWSGRPSPTYLEFGSTYRFTRDQSWYDLICTVDPITPTTVYIGGIDLYRSTNSGTNWTRITSWYGGGLPAVHSDQHVITIRPDIVSNAVVGNDGGIFYCTNINTGNTFYDGDLGYNVTQYYAVSTHPTDPNYYLAGAQDNGTERFTQPGLNNAPDVIGGDGAFNFIDKTNGNNQIASYVYNNYYVSNDNGLSFYDLAGNDNTGRFINPADLDDVNDILYSAAGNDQLARRTNVFSIVGGVSAATRTNLTVSIGGVQASAIRVSPNDPTTVYVGTSSGNIYRVTNANGTPTSTLIGNNLTALGGYVNSIDVWKKVNGTADDSIVVAYSNYGVNSVYYTANGSSSTPTWTNIDDNNTLPDIPVRWVVFSPVNNKIILLATEVGVFGSVSINGNSTQWSQINNGMLPMVRTDMIKPNSLNQLAAATHGRGLWTSDNIAPLPLRILSFNAAPKGDDVTLQWTVADDRGAAYYTVERMYSNEATFTPIEQVTAHNSSQYVTTDVRPDWSRGAIIYRLKCTDLSGKSFYSATQRVQKGAGATSFISSVYPTLTDDVLQIAVGNANTTSMHIVVRSASGQTVLAQTSAYKDQVIHLGTLPAGLYFVTITDITGQYKQTIPVMKK